MRYQKTSLFILGFICFFQLVDAAELVTRKFEIPYLNAFSFEGPGKIEITQGDENVFMISGDKALIEKINIEISRGELEISPIDPSFSYKFPTVLEGKLTVQDLSRISIDGNVNVDINELKVQNLMIDIGALGLNILEGNISVNRLAVIIRGNSFVYFHGNADDQMIYIPGSGTYEGTKLLSKTAAVNIQGSGEVYVYPTEKLIATVMDFAQVYYFVEKGKPNPFVDGEGNISPLILEK